VELLNSSLPVHQRFVESDKHHFERYFRQICNRVASGEWTETKGDAVFDNLFTRYSTCYQGVVKPAYLTWLHERKAHQAILNVYAKYCRDTWNASEKRPKRINDETTKWLRVELFCETTRYFANPPGLTGVLRPSDWEGVKRLDRQAESLCLDLRAGKISIDDARYRWQQEVLWVREHIHQDAAKALTSSKVFDFLLDILKKF
jgi:hypothetical protein